MTASRMLFKNQTELYAIVHVLTTTQPLFSDHHALARMLFKTKPSYMPLCMYLQQHNHSFTTIRIRDFVGATFYCPHALADGKQRIRIREKTLEFSSTLLCVIHTVSVPPILT